MLGCATFLRLSSGKLHNTDAVQITLLAVRKKNRRLGIGRYLMQVYTSNYPNMAASVNRLATGNGTTNVNPTCSSQGQAGPGPA